MEIPRNGTVVRLMPVDQQPPSSTTPPPLQTSTLKRITEAYPSFVTLEGGMDFDPKDETRIYDNLGKTSYKLWKSYKPGYGKMMEDATSNLLKTKYIDISETRGGRTSYKKSKKSSKPSRSMKRYISKSRKYSRHK